MVRDNPEYTDNFPNEGFEGTQLGKRETIQLKLPVICNAERQGGEDSVAFGKAVIPLPCPESLENGAFNTAITGTTTYRNSTTDNCDENQHRYVGLVNQAMTCYLNSLIQTLYMTSEFRNAIYRWRFTGSISEEVKNIPYQLQKLFLQLQISDKASLETKDLTASFGWDSNEAYDQHDVQELCRIMFDALEHRWRNTENRSVIQDLYKGTMEDYVKCLNCETEKVRKDVFLDLPLAVKQFGAQDSFKTIEEAMSAFIKPEVLSGNNQYECERCASKQDAEKGLRITEFPYLLTIQLKRFDFDYQTLHRIKLNDRITFPDYLDINGFVYTPPPPPPPKLSYAAMAKKPKPDPPIETGDESPPEVPTTSHTMIDSERNWLNESANSERVMQMLKRGKYVYELFSIMVHQGSASAGHYFAYIKNLDQNKWFCFNDSSVQPASLNDIYRTFGGYPYSWSNNTNAYMLMYRQLDPQKNKHFIRTMDLPAHLKELQEKLQLEEDERIKRQQYEQALVKITFACNEESCINNEYSPVLLHRDVSLDIVFDELLGRIRDADEEKFRTGAAKPEERHLAEHLQPGCQRLILCESGWEMKDVLVEEVLMSSNADGSIEGNFIVGGDEDYKKPLSSLLYLFSETNSYMPLIRQEIHLMVDTKSPDSEFFYAFPQDTRQRNRTFEVYQVNLDDGTVRLAKRICSHLQCTISDFKLRLAEALPSVARGEPEISSMLKNRSPKKEQKATNNVPSDGRKTEKSGDEKNSDDLKISPLLNGDEKQTEQKREDSSEYSPTSVAGEQSSAISQWEPHCRLVFDRSPEDAPIGVFGPDRNGELLGNAGFSTYGTVDVYVDVGTSEMLNSDRAIQDFNESKMANLILRKKYSRPIKVLLPTKTDYKSAGMEIPNLSADFVYSSAFHASIKMACNQQQQDTSQKIRLVAVVVPLPKTEAVPPPPPPPPHHSASCPVLPSNSPFKNAAMSIMQNTKQMTPNNERTSEFRIPERHPNMYPLPTPVQVQVPSTSLLTIQESNLGEAGLEDVGNSCDRIVDDPFPNVEPTCSAQVQAFRNSKEPPAVPEMRQFVAEQQVDPTPTYDVNMVEQGEQPVQDEYFATGGFSVDDPTPPPPYHDSSLHLQQPIEAALHLSPTDEASCSSLPVEPDPNRGMIDEDIVMGGDRGRDEELESTDDGEQQQLLAEADEDIGDPAMDLSSCPSTPKISPVVSEASGDEADCSGRLVRSERMGLMDMDKMRNYEVDRIDRILTAINEPGWCKATATTTTTDMDKEEGGMDEAATSDTLVGGTESTSDSTATPASGASDIAGASQIKILELNTDAEQPYVVIELDKRQRTIQLMYWLSAFQGLDQNAFKMLKHYRESDTSGFPFNPGETELVKDSLATNTHLTVRLAISSANNDQSSSPSSSTKNDQQGQESIGDQQRWKRRERPLRIKMLSVSESE